MAESIASPRARGGPADMPRDLTQSRTVADTAVCAEPTEESLVDPGAPLPGMVVPLPRAHLRGRPIERCLVVTHVVQPGEDLEELAERYLAPHVRPGDIAVVGQKVASVCQGRCIPLAEVRVRALARLLSRTVRRTPHGLGLRRPETMEMALREVGTWRILYASLHGAWDRVKKRSGSFYRVAGSRVWAIDGPGPETLAPYDRFIVLAPDDPDRLARQVARRLGTGACIVDVNDLSAAVLGASPGVDRRLVREALRDNPMGQGRAQTPLGLLRPLPATYRASHTSRRPGAA